MRARTSRSRACFAEGLLKNALAASGAMDLTMAETDPDFDCLRDDPQFRKIIADAKKRLAIEVAAAS